MHSNEHREERKPKECREMKASRQKMRRRRGREVLGGSATRTAVPIRSSKMREREERTCDDSLGPVRQRNQRLRINRRVAAVRARRSKIKLLSRREDRSAEKPPP